MATEIQLDGYPENLWACTVTIPSGASESEIVVTQGRALVNVIVSPGWDAANIAVKAGIVKGTVYPGTGNLRISNASAGQYTAFPTSDAVFAPYISVQSVDNSGVAVNQTAARVLTLIFRRFVS